MLSDQAELVAQTAAPADASTPAATIAAFADYLSAGDLDGAVGLYEPDTVFQPAPDVPAVHGPRAIREALAGLPPRARR